jgi:HD superfamily phosphohydrolase
LIKLCTCQQERFNNFRQYLLFLPLYNALLSFGKTIRLPEYGYIGVTRLEESLIDTQYFQRLRRIRQSPGVFMVFPGSSHTRFEHSLGAMHMAGEASTYLLLNMENLGQKPNSSKPIIEYLSETAKKANFASQVQISRIAALLHDIGHAPFSHTFEEFLKMSSVEWKHEHLSIQIIYTKMKDIFKSNTNNPCNIDVRHIIALLCDIEDNHTIREDTKKFLIKIGLTNADITFMNSFLSGRWYLNDLLTANYINVDRLNYLILDSNRSGTKEYGAIDVDRLVQNLYLFNDVITVSTKAQDAFVRFYEAYSHMYRTVISHKTSLGADIHLALAMYLVSKLKTKSIFKKLTKANMNDILRLSDDVLIFFLSKIKDASCRRLISDYLSRNILYMAYNGKSGKFKEILDVVGTKGLSSKIKKQANLSSDATVFVQLVRERDASPISDISSDTIKRLMLLNVRTKSLEPLDYRLSRMLGGDKETCRIYCSNDTEVKNKIAEVIRQGVD